MSGRGRYGGKWQTAPLSAMASIRDKRVEPSEVEGGTLCVELEHIGQGNGRLTGYGTAERVSTKCRFEIGDILFGRLRPYLRKWWHADRPGICSTEIWPLVPDSSRTDSTFLYTLVQAGRLHDAANASYGTHMPRADWSVVAEVELPLPPLPEQRAIAAVLTDVDALIGSLEALIAKKRAIKRAAMQQLLTGRTRLPGFSGEWATRRIAALAEVDPENLPSSTSPGFAFNYISLDDVDAGRLVGYSRESFATAPSRARRVVRQGDVLMSTVRPALQGHLLFSGQAPNAICSTGFAVLRTKPNEGDSRFLFAHLLGDVVGAQVQSLLAGSNYPAINSADVARLRITCPPTLAEQRAIATVLTDMGDEIAALESRLDKTRAIKQGMIQQLLTGAVRLPISDDGLEGESHDA